MEEQFRGDYVAGLWLRFRAGRGWRYCQPDGLAFDFARGRLTVVEIKLRHTPRAERQLRELYAPVVARLFPGWDLHLLEVCHWFEPDPACTLTRDPRRTRPRVLNLHILGSVRLRNYQDRRSR